MSWHLPAFWYRESGSWWPYLLTPLAWIFRGLTALRRTLKIPRNVDSLVISVGNLTVGGAGKTPLVKALCQYYQRSGNQPHILIRGYGGSLRGNLRVNPARHTAAEVGDEALYLSQHGFPVWIGKNRFISARLALMAGADVLIVDDGHQDLSLAKHFKIVVVDGTFGLGNSRVMPAGPLRESRAQGLRSADAVVIMGKDACGLSTQFSNIPTLMIKPQFVPPYQPHHDAQLPNAAKILAFSGIGLPEKFRKALVSAGYNVIDFIAFPDHHPFTHDDLERLQKSAAMQGLPLVTTGKDFVRLPVDWQNRIYKADIEVNVAMLTPYLENLRKILCVFSRKRCI